MTEALALASALAADEPETAAAVLADLDPAVVVAFLDALPEGKGPATLSGLPSPVAAACLEAVPTERAALWLQAIGYPFKIHIARAMASAKLAAVLEVVPRSMARQISRDLAYSPETVGAWMEDTGGVVADDDTVGECLPRLRRQRRAVETTLVVAGRGRKYVGLLRLGRLVGARDRERLGALADRSVVGLAPDTPLVEVVDRVEWASHLLLPVVGRRNSLLGVLRAERLQRALVQQASTEAALGSGLAGHLLEAALLSATSLALLFPEESAAAAGEEEEA